MHIEKEKYNEALVKLRHDLRQSKTYKNQDIDLSRSCYNYTFNDWDPIDKFNNRIDQVYIYGKNGKNKDNINYLCSIVVQYPKDCPISEDDFFKKIVGIFFNYFGSENVISAVVHKDEKGQSHLHFKFMPVVKMDKPKNGYTEKLCAKEVVNREMLKTFHEDVETDFYRCYGIKLSLKGQQQRQYVNDIYEFKELKQKYNQLVDMYNNALTKVISLKDYINYQKSRERTNR